MIAFIGNTLRGKVSGENFDESLFSHQNLSDFSPSKFALYGIIVCITTYAKTAYIHGYFTSLTYIAVYALIVSLMHHHNQHLYLGEMYGTCLGYLSESSQEPSC